VFLFGLMFYSPQGGSIRGFFSNTVIKGQSQSTEVNKSQLRYVGRSVGRLVGWSVGRSVDRLVGWSIDRSVGQSVG
jgi:hypothetical protein